MNAFGGVGCPPAQGNNDSMFLLLMLMILCPGMFGHMGGNQMMICMLICMMMSGGMV